MIGYKASAIAHKANDEGTTLREAALAAGDIDAKRFDEIVDPKAKIGDGLAGALRGFITASPRGRTRTAIAQLITLR